VLDGNGNMEFDFSEFMNRQEEQGQASSNAELHDSSFSFFKSF